jgi:hypothetical protein
VLQAEIGGGGPAAHRDQDLVAGELPAVRDPGHDRAVRAHPTGLDHPRSGHHGDALGLERGAQLLAGERLFARQQPVRTLQNHDLLAAEPPERLGHLSPDGAAAEHEEPAGDLLGAGRRPVVPRPGLGQPGNRRDHRAAARGQHDGPGRSEPQLGAALGLDLDGPFPGQPAGAADQRDARALQPARLPVVVPARRHVVPPREGGRDVQPAGDRLGGARRPSRCRQHVARPQQGLGRDAAPVRALAAGQLSFHDGDPQAAVGQPPGRMLPGRAGADDHDVVGVHHSDDQVVSKEGYRVRPPSMNSVWPVM